MFLEVASVFILGCNAAVRPLLFIVECTVVGRAVRVSVVDEGFKFRLIAAAVAACIPVPELQKKTTVTDYCKNSSC